MWQRYRFGRGVERRFRARLRLLQLRRENSGLRGDLARRPRNRRQQRPSKQRKLAWLPSEWPTRAGKRIALGGSRRSASKRPARQGGGGGGGGSPCGMPVWRVSEP